MKFLFLLILGVKPSLPQNIEDRRFAGNVYKEMVKRYNGSFLACPFSVKSILALARLGAEGETAQELSKGLNLPDDADSIREYIKKLLARIQDGKGLELTSASRIYINSSSPIHNQFKSTAIEVFKSEVRNLNFRNTLLAAKAINKWIEDQTNNTIRNVLDKNTLDKNSVLVLINALYFHGTWKTQFDKHFTTKKKFFLSRKRSVNTDMMELTSQFQFYEHSKLSAQFLQLPYDGNDVTLTLVLPKVIGGLSKLEAHISEVLASPSYMVVNTTVVIPKFKINTTIDFKPILRALGVNNAFSESAIFSGISSKHLAISQVLQKTFIEVDEKGTTAAASSVGNLKIVRSTPQLLYFVANHPFMFFLKCKTDIIFVGRYTGRKTSEKFNNRRAMETKCL